jgi:hypothetical protein
MTPAKLISRFTPLAFAVALTGCVVLPPAGPSYQALPGSRLSYDQFQVDDAACRQYATAQVGGRSAPESAQESAAASTVAGTIGAAFGGSSESAAVGAGIGLLTGAMIGLSTSEASYYAVQGRYDGAYYQCMYARGHRVPVSSRYAETRRAPVAPVAPPADAAVPPPNAPPPAAPYVPPYWPSAPR